jgi:hypothetical protein
MAAHEEAAEQSQNLATDAQLFERARVDADAFRELYERYAEAIYAYHCRCSPTATRAA